MIKNLFLFLIFGVTVGSVRAQNAKNLCSQHIFLDEIGSGFLLETSLDTTIIEEGEAFYLKVVVKSCRGAMYIERYKMKSKAIVFSGNYQDAIKEDTVNLWATDPVTLNRRLIKNREFKPIKTGTWKYYDNQGKLMKIDEYDQGKLVSSSFVSEGN